MKRLLLVLVAVIVLLVGAAAGFLFLWDDHPDYDVPSTSLEIPSFSLADVPFTHQFQHARGLPFAAGAVIDIDNDGVDELFVGGGVRQSDGLFGYVDGNFVNLPGQADLVKQGDAMTLGAAVLDVDANGFRDLIVSRETGVWLYLNENGRFTMVRLDLAVAPHEAPLTAALADLNGDGHVDFFLPAVGRTAPLDWLKGSAPDKKVFSRLYINNGDNTFTDFTVGAGLMTVGEALQAVFADLDGDGLDDLAVLHGDGTFTIWQNSGSLLFARKSTYPAEGGADFSGMAAGDWDGNGRLDFLLTNRGETLPEPLLRLLESARINRSAKWALLSNGGAFIFEEKAAQAQLANYELGRGAVLADINCDGRCDVVVAQNHPFWPPHWPKQTRLQGRQLLQNTAGAFAGVTLPPGNPSFGVSPLLADFNGDGRPDILFVNLKGQSRAFLSKEGGNQYLLVRLADTARSLGATVTVTTLGGKMLQQNYLVGKALCGDSTHDLFFGLGDDTAVDVTVRYRDGAIEQTSGELINRVVRFD